MGRSSVATGLVLTGGNTILRASCKNEHDQADCESWGPFLRATRAPLYKGSISLVCPALSCYCICVLSYTGQLFR
jgi:hypothetical protein